MAQRMGFMTVLHQENKRQTWFAGNLVNCSDSWWNVCYTRFVSNTIFIAAIFFKAKPAILICSQFRKMWMVGYGREFFSWLHSWIDAPILPQGKTLIQWSEHPYLGSIFLVLCCALMRQIACERINTESTRKLSNFNFQWTKTLYQNNLKNIVFLFTFFKG